MLRVRKEDTGKKSCARYFVINEAYTNQNGDEVTDERWGELLDILEIEVGDRIVTLCKARWYALAAGFINCDTETPRLKLNLRWDVHTSNIIEASEIISQVVVVPLLYSQNEAVVLDRRFDTRRIPDPLDASSSDEEEDDGIEGGDNHDDNDEMIEEESDRDMEEGDFNNSE